MKKDSTLGAARPGTVRSRQPEPTRKYVRTEPTRRIQPLLMTQWKYLWREEFVELRSGGRITAAGWVNDLTPDGTIIWICLTGGRGRVMVHRDEGIEIWRVDSRILQGRSSSGQQEPTEYRRGKTQR